MDRACAQRFVTLRCKVLLMMQKWIKPLIRWWVEFVINEELSWVRLCLRFYCEYNPASFMSLFCLLMRNSFLISQDSWLTCHFATEEERVKWFKEEFYNFLILCIIYMHFAMRAILGIHWIWSFRKNVTPELLEFASDTRKLIIVQLAQICNATFESMFNCSIEEAHLVYFNKYRTWVTPESLFLMYCDWHI